MKTITVIKKILPYLLVLFFTFSCNQDAENKAAEKNDKVNTESKKDTTTKEDPGVPDKKSTGKNWNANGSAAQVKFSVKGPFGTVNGSLSGLKSVISFDKDNLAASSIRASVNPASISTGIKLRNSDLKNEKYLDTDKYPSISFQSENIQKSGTGYKAIGNLTIKGITKRQEIPFTFSEKGNTGVFKGSFIIQRQDYGIGKTGGSIGNTISIDLEVPVTK